MRNLRLHWDAKQGWLLDVPFALPAHSLKQVVSWALPRQVSRLRSLPPGEKKDELTRALKLLQAGEVQQNVVGDRGDGKGDLLLFSAPRDPEDRKIISIGK